MCTLIFYPVFLTLEFDLLFEKSLTLLINFEKLVLEVWCFTWLFLVTEPFYEIQDLWSWPWPWSLAYFMYILTLFITFECFDLNIWPMFWKKKMTMVILLLFFFNKDKILELPYCTQSFFLWQDFSTGIKVFVLVILAIFGIGHYHGHLCFTNTSCSFCFHLL